MKSRLNSDEERICGMKNRSKKLLRMARKKSSYTFYL